MSVNKLGIKMRTKEKKTRENKSKWDWKVQIESNKKILKIGKRVWFVCWLKEIVVLSTLWEEEISEDSQVVLVHIKCLNPLSSNGYDEWGLPLFYSPIS